MVGALNFFRFRVPFFLDLGILFGIMCVACTAVQFICHLRMADRRSQNKPEKFAGIESQGPEGGSNCEPNLDIKPCPPNNIILMLRREVQNASRGFQAASCHYR
jgi:hypothetical protein